MILLMHGPDTYRSRKKLNEIISEYRRVSGSDFNVHRLDAEEEILARLKGVMETGSLFESKKLIVIENLFSSAQDIGSLEDVLKNAKDANDTILILWDGMLGAAQKKAMARVEKFASKTQNFEFLKEADLKKWIQYEARERGLALSLSEIAALSSKGGDLWAIAHALDKKAVAPSASLARESGVSPTLFQLGDVFFTSPRRALFLLNLLFAGGEDEFGVFSYLANYARTLYAVKFYSEKKEPLPRDSGIHPFAAKKAGELARSLEQSEIESFLRRFFEEDVRIKTGETKPKEALERILFISRKRSSPRIS